MFLVPPWCVRTVTPMVDALKEDLRKQKVPDPNTAPPLYESDTDSDATAIDAESSPMQEPLRNVRVAINNNKNKNNYFILNTILKSLTLTA